MSACTKCGRDIQGRPNFCPGCGSSLTFGTGGGADPLLGRVIDGSYEIEALIGEGAMGRVYKANQIQLRKQVAVKILRSNLVDDVTVVKRFEREALAASRLNHPNCISIYGFGQEDDGELLWMAMELIRGRDLGTIIAEDSPLPAARTVHIIGQVCEALDEAHSANIIHRDLKPANIVCFDHRRTPDFVKVLDFGIAKITDPGADYQPLTRDGIVCGTPAYMSPEQVQGFELDNRSDLFALGIILYQTLTGALPFHAESAVEVATKIVIEDPVPPSKVRSDWSYPPELEQIALRLLRKKKEERYANAIEVKDALEKCMATLRARHDVSLEMNPDEVAELIADPDAPLEGAKTLQLSADMIAQAMAADGSLGFGGGAKPAQAPPAEDEPALAALPILPAEPTEPQPPHPRPEEERAPTPSESLRAPPPPMIMTQPTSAARQPDNASNRGRNTGVMVGIAAAAAVAVAVAIGVIFFLSIGR